MMDEKADEIIASIVLFIALDIFFALELPRQNFLTYLIAPFCILFIGWCFPSREI